MNAPASLVPRSPAPLATPGIFADARWRTAVLISAAVLYFALQVGSYSQKSVTYDEPVHLAAGYAALVNGDHRLDACHPPFVRMWAALPLLAMSGLTFDSPRLDPLTQEDTIVQQNAIAHDFLYDGADVDRALGRARFMVVLIGALLGLLVFCWAREWLGFPTALLALGFYLLSPNLGAHATLVTTDLGITCFVFGTIYFLWRTARKHNAWNVAGVTGFFSLAVVTKFSAVLLVPICAVLLAIAGRRSGELTWRRSLALLAWMAGTAWFAIWLVYGFRYEPSATAGWVFHTHEMPTVQRQLPVIVEILHWVDEHRLLPNAYTHGFMFGLALSENAPAYMAGEVSAEGWWHYYPFAILVKTPVTLLALLLAGLAGLSWHLRSRTTTWDALCVVLPVVIYLGFAMNAGINLGLRHVLPVYPFFVMIACVAGRQILNLSHRPRFRFGILAALLGIWVASFARVYPHTLTFFNLVAGGPKRGSEHLVDSNLDWGQHLKLLKKWMDVRGVARINLAYFGTADPEYRGLSCVLLPGTRDYLAARISRPELPGYVAISKTVASGVYMPPEWREFYAGFESLEPVAEIGHTLSVYHVGQWPDPGDTQNDDELVARGLLAERLRVRGWPKCAVAMYRNYLRHRPDDIAAHVHLAQALADDGDRVAADAAYRRGMELARGPFDPNQQLAARLIARRNFRTAVDLAHTLTRVLPDHAAAKDLLGIALAGAGRLADARKEFEAAVRRDPTNPVFRRHLDRAIHELGGVR